MCGPRYTSMYCRLGVDPAEFCHICTRECVTQGGPCVSTPLLSENSPTLHGRKDLERSVNMSHWFIPRYAFRPYCAINHFPRCKHIFWGYFEVYWSSLRKMLLKWLCAQFVAYQELLNELNCFWRTVIVNKFSLTNCQSVYILENWGIFTLSGSMKMLMYWIYSLLNRMITNIS